MVCFNRFFPSLAEGKSRMGGKKMKKVVIGILIGIILVFALMGVMAVLGYSPSQIISQIASVFPGGEGNSGPPEGFPEDTGENYPYLATLTPGLEGKIEVRYGFTIEDSGDNITYGCQAKLTNLSSQTITWLSAELTLKSADGNFISDLSGMGEGARIKPGQAKYFGGYGGIFPKLTLPAGLSMADLWIELTIVNIQFQ